MTPHPSEVTHLLTKAIPSLFGALADEKILGGNLIQDDLLRIMVHQAVGDMVFDEEKEALVCLGGIQSALLRATPVHLFDDKKAHMPSSSFVTEDRLFVSTSDLVHYLLQGEHACHNWLKEGALSCAYLFAKNHHPDAVSFMPYHASSWKESELSHLSKAFSFQERLEITKYLTTPPCKVLDRLQALSEHHPSPLSRLLKDIHVLREDGFHTERSTEDVWVELFDKHAVRKIRHLFREGIEKDKLSAKSEKVIQTWAQNWFDFHQVESQTYFARFHEIVSPIIFSPDKTTDPSQFLSQVVQVHASASYPSSPNTAHLIGILSSVVYKHKNSTSPQVPHPSFQNLVSMYALAETDPSLKDSLLQDVPLSNVLQALDTIANTKGLTEELIFSEHPNNCPEMDQALTLLSKNAQERDDTKLAVWSLGAIVHQQDLVSSLKEESARVLPSFLINHKYHQSSHKHIPDFISMCFSNQTISDNPSLASAMMMKLVEVITSPKEPQALASQMVAMDHLAPLLPRILTPSSKKEKKTWTMLERLAYSPTAFPLFQHELTKWMIDKDLFDIEGQHKKKWDALSHIVHKKGYEDVKLSFKQSFDLSLQKDLKVSLHDTLTQKAKEEEHLPAKKAKM